MQIINDLPTLYNTQSPAEIEADQDKHNKAKALHSTYMKSRFTCECGCSLIRSNATAHRRSKKHGLLLAALSKHTTYDKLRDILKLSIEICNKHKKSVI